MGLFPTRKGKRIFISWVKHSTRSASFAQALEANRYFCYDGAAFSVGTNAELAGRVEEMGGKSIVLTDIPYTMEQSSYPVDTDKFTVCFVCTYSPDEPIVEIFKAARRLPEVLFYMTGNDKKADEEIRNARPDNVVMTGYLTNDEYFGLIRGVSAMMALTTWDFTMQRGGSEAMTAGKPLITSDWPIVRETFSRGTAHVENTAAGIAEGIQRVRDNLDHYRREIVELRHEREASWNAVKTQIEKSLSNVCRNSVRAVCELVCLA